MCYSVLCMEMRSCHNSAAGNIYYLEETHVQKGDKETVCSRGADMCSMHVLLSTTNPQNCW